MTESYQDIGEESVSPFQRVENLTGEDVDGLVASEKTVEAT
jgi:hypothetical protein